MNEILTLVNRILEPDGYTIESEIRREVFCRFSSIGTQEFYQAQATELRPEFKFVIADYLDYNCEYLRIYEEQWYRVIRTYRKGQELEITVQLASVEEVEFNG